MKTWHDEYTPWDREAHAISLIRQDRANQAASRVEPGDKRAMVNLRLATSASKDAVARGIK